MSETEIWYHGTGGRDVAVEDGAGRFLEPLPPVGRYGRPADFTWGYEGAGPADLAYALLVHALGTEAHCPECAGTRKIGWDRAAGTDAPYDPSRPGDFDPETVGSCWCIDGRRELPYQRFKREHVARWPQGGEWRMSRTQIRTWLGTI